MRKATGLEPARIDASADFSSCSTFFPVVGIERVCLVSIDTSSLFDYWPVSVIGNFNYSNIFHFISMIFNKYCNRYIYIHFITCLDILKFQQIIDKF